MKHLSRAIINHMQSTICILGRQPALGLAELESIFGPEVIRPIGDSSVEVSVDPKTFELSRLGGTIKAAKLLTVLDTTDWRKLVAYIIKSLPDHLPLIPEGKIRLGLSVCGLNVPVRDIHSAGLAIKKSITVSGRSARVVPNKLPELNSAQIIHNQLTGPTGLELLFIRDGDKTFLAQTTQIQDIAGYSERDYGRPMRDAKIGMLPPKLAQIIINLAAGSADKASLLDPFCGSGVIVQEALLMGHHAFGTDLDQRMVDYANQNIKQLIEKSTKALSTKIYKADATTANWSDLKINTIAAETYLGKPLHSTPPPGLLRELIEQAEKLHRKTLENIASQTKPGFRLCLAIPAWKTGRNFVHLPLLDDLENLGYTRLSFAHADSRDLIYYRDSQFVGRELVVLIRKKD